MIKSPDNYLPNPAKSMKRSAIREIRFEGEPMRLMCGPDKTGKNAMRLNFSFSNPEEIEVGIKRLAMAIREELTGN